MKKKLLKTTSAVVLVLLAVLLGTYFYVSSGRFVRTQVFPRVAAALGTEIQSGDVAFSAFNHIEIKNLRVGTEADPLLLAGHIRMRYRALSILSGKVEVNEVLLRDVTVAVTPEKLKVLTKAGPAEKAPSKPSEPAKPRIIAVRNVKVQNLSLSYVQAGDSAERMELLVPQLDLDLPELVTGKDFRLTVAAQAKAVVGERIDAEVRDISVNLKGSLGQDLLPTLLNLTVNVKGMAGTAGSVVLDGRRVQAAVELAGDGPQRWILKRLSLAEYDHETKDAELVVTGELGAAPPSAALDLAMEIPPGSLLNVVGALAGGLEFGQTAVSYKGHVDMPSQGSLASRGELHVRDLTLAVPSAGVPALRPLQIAANYDLGMDLTSHTLTLSRLDATVTDGGRDVVAVALDRAVALDLQDPVGAAAARLSMKIDRFDLTMFNALLAKQQDLRIVSGELNRDMQLDIEQGGRRIVLQVGGGGVDKLVMRQGGKQIGPLRIDHEAKLQLTEFKTLDIEHFKVGLVPLAAGAPPAATVFLGGTMELVPEPIGQLTARIEGDGAQLMELARPFLGELDFAIGQPRLAGRIELDLRQGAANPNVDFYLSVTGIEATSSSLGLERPLALDIVTHLQGGLRDGGHVVLEPGYFRVNGFGQDGLVHVTVEKTSFALDDMQTAPGKVVLPTSFSVNDLDLAKLLPFLPKEAGIAKLAGNVKILGGATVTGPGQAVRLDMKAAIEGLDFSKSDGTALAAPLSPSLGIALDYAVGGVAGIKHMDVVLQRTGEPEPLLSLNVAGSFDTGMDPDVKNVISASTRGTVLLDELEKLVVRPEGKEEATQASAPRPAPGGEKEEGPNLWIAMEIDVARATYRQMVIEDLAVEAEYRNAKLDLSKGQLLLNGGMLEARGSVDLRDPEKPDYDLAASVTNLPFAPVLSSFMPKAARFMSGGFKAADIELKGTGFDMPSLQDNLSAKMTAQLDRLVVEPLEGTAGRLTDLLLLSLFNMGWSDMNFAGGGLDLAVDKAQFGDHDIHFRQLRLQAPLFLLDGSGSLQLGGAWTPDLEIKTGFSEGKATSLRSGGFDIAVDGDASGYHAGPTIPLKGDLTNLRNQAGIATAVLASAGKISRKDAQTADLANQVLGVLKGDEDSDAGATLGGILNRVFETPPEQEKEEEKKKDETTEVIGNLLKGIFGN